MSESQSKYKVIYRSDTKPSSENPILWEPGCPLVFEAVQISRNTQTGEAYLQAKVRNISQKKIASFLSTIVVDYQEGSPQEILFHPLDADLTPGQVLVFPSEKLRQGDAISAKAVIKKVSFDDGEWTSSEVPSSIPRPQSLGLSKDAVEERRLQIFKDSKIEEKDERKIAANDCEIHGGWWLCPCGQVNVERDICVNCGIPLASLENEDVKNEEKLSAAYKERVEKAAQLEKERIEREKRRKEEREKRRKKIVKRVTPFALAVIAIAIFVISAASTSFFGLIIQEKDSMEQYSWDELSKISGEIARCGSEEAAIEVAKKYHLVSEDGILNGNQRKSVQLSNGKRTYVQIAGFNHDEKSDGGKAGITFIFEDALGFNSMYLNSSEAAHGWIDSSAREWLSNDGMNMLPADLVEKIVSVKKLTNNVGQTTDVSSVTETTDKLWLFSAKELSGDIDWFKNNGDNPSYDDVLNAEGTQYKAFKDAIDRSRLLKRYNDNLVSWWDRSQMPNSTNRFAYTNGWGLTGDSDIDTRSLYLVPGFCI